MSNRVSRTIRPGLLLCAVAVCARAQQTALDPAGAHAQAIASLGAFFSLCSTAIFVAVIAMTLLPLLRQHRGIDQEPLEKTHLPSASTDRQLGRRVAIASVASVVILFGLIILSVSTGKATSGAAQRAPAVVIEVTANQWWWYVRYLNDDASRIVVTANEMHIPVGRP